MGFFRNLFEKLRSRLIDTQRSRRKHLAKELRKAKEDLDRSRRELTESKIEIEECVHSMKPGSKQEDFVPPFHIWCEFPEIQELNIEQALDQYIEKYNLLRPVEPDEPIAVTRITAMLKVLENSRDKFTSEVAADLDSYIFRLQGSLAMERMRGEIHKKAEALDKRIETLNKKSGNGESSGS